MTCTNKTREFNLLDTNLIHGKSVGANKKDKTTIIKALLTAPTKFVEFFDEIISDKARLSAIEKKKGLILASDINITSFTQELILKFLNINKKKNFISKFEKVALEKLNNSFSTEILTFVFKCDDCQNKIDNINRKCLICVECFDAYHFTCANVTAKDNNWVCHNC